jgi:D-amino-acid dehydrogenase
MHLAVLGAGVVGVTAAWYLRDAGCEVTVIDRHDAVAAETSFANGGQISVSHAEPWATPRALRKLPTWLLDRDSPLRLRPGTDPALWRWLLAFLRECRPARVDANVRDLVSLGLYSRSQLQALRAKLDLHYEQRTLGILHVYTDAGELRAATEAAALMRDLGCARDVLDVDAALAIEPALQASASRLVGATYTADDESGDAHAFTRQLADHCRRRGVDFLLGQHIDALEADGAGIAAAQLRGADGIQRFRADAFVLALGSYSAALARPLGLDLPIQAAKGYSLTMPVREPVRAWNVSLTDDEHRLVFSRLGERLRVAGMAELGGVDLHLDPRRCELLLRHTEALFPGAGDATQARYWCGLRPSTPSNLPRIGRTRFHNLFLDTGHGTLGWTHACGSGRALADIVCGRPSAIAFPFSN